MPRVEQVPRYVTFDRQSFESREVAVQHEFKRRLFWCLHRAGEITGAYSDGWMSGYNLQHLLDAGMDHPIVLAITRDSINELLGPNVLELRYDDAGPSCEVVLRPLWSDDDAEPPGTRVQPEDTVRAATDEDREVERNPTLEKSQGQMAFEDRLLELKLACEGLTPIDQVDRTELGEYLDKLDAAVGALREIVDADTGGATRASIALEEIYGD